MAVGSSRQPNRCEKGEVEEKDGASGSGGEKKAEEERI